MKTIIAIALFAALMVIGTMAGLGEQDVQPVRWEDSRANYEFTLDDDPVSDERAAQAEGRMGVNK